MASLLIGEGPFGSITTAAKNIARFVAAGELGLARDCRALFRRRRGDDIGDRNLLCQLIAYNELNAIQFLANEGVALSLDSAITALAHGRVHIAKWLESCGYQFQPGTDDSADAAIVAVKRNQVAALDWLLNGRCTVDKKYCAVRGAVWGTNLQYLAVECGHVPILKCLAKHGLLCRESADSCVGEAIGKCQFDVLYFFECHGLIPSTEEIQKNSKFMSKLPLAISGGNMLLLEFLEANRLLPKKIPDLLALAKKGGEETFDMFQRLGYFSEQSS